MTNKMQFTESQEQAITGKFPGNAIVSANAGSGKTRVLVNRVLNKIKNGVSIDRLLIVTFTKKAAKEMRDRIKVALQQEINQATDPQEKQALIKQLRKVPIAHIQTMDAFCEWLVSKYYYAIDLDPDFRLLSDKTEDGMFRDVVWDRVREDLYGNDKDGNFAALTRNFSNDRGDDGLTNTVMKVYDFANVNEDPKAWLSKLPDLYNVNGDLGKSQLFQELIKPEIKNKLELVISIYKDAKQRYESNGLVGQADVINEFLEYYCRLTKQLDSAGFDELYEEFHNSPSKKMPSVKKGSDQKEISDAILQIKNDGKNQFKKIVNRYFAYKENDNLEVIRESQKIVGTLADAVTKFMDSFSQFKKQKHAFEFNDVEHFAYQILNGDNEDSQEIKRQFQFYFDEIMVDEYQDNNRLQDAILNSLKNPNRENLFMVGDVKQSIYRFRLADPSMFLDKLNNYQDNGNENTAITLADNFRSMENIDKFINMIFSQIMDNQVGKVDYENNAQLKFGANKYPDGVQSPVDVMMYENDDESQNQLGLEDSSEGEIEMVAEKIESLFDSDFQIFDSKLGKMRNIQYGDIAVLSPTRGKNLQLSQIFAEHGIPIETDGSESYFKTTEVQIMMSLLSIIDNPYQDIPLAAVLRSPIVAMDENELAYLRINGNTGDYFSSLMSFYKKYPSEKPTEFGNQVYRKVNLFLKQLDDFKDYATKHELADLIWYIYEQTGFLDYVNGMPAGKKRAANLHALYERAGQYEESSFKGLFAFVQFVKRLQDKDQDLGEPESEVNPDSVSAMTIHGSKGLEFPVVFLLDANHGFNKTDLNGRFILNDDLGIGIKYLDHDKHKLFSTLPFIALNDIEKNQLQNEKMRQLYVALTRAEQKLIICGMVKNKKDHEKEIEKWNKAQNAEETVLPAALRSSASTFMDWIGWAIVRHPSFSEDFGDDVCVHPLPKNAADFTVSFVTTEDLKRKSGQHLAESEKKQGPAEAATDLKTIDDILNFHYPYQSATATTAYQSVSEIKHLFEDPDNIQLGSASDSRNRLLKRTRYNTNTFKQPQFMQTVGQPNVLEVGTATHLVLQKLDVTKPINETVVKQQINQMVADNLIDKGVSERIKVPAIVNFFATDLGKLIQKHPEQLSREAPFSLIIAANQLFSEFQNDPKQMLLVHGIIDGFLNQPNGIILFDYKTDFVNPSHPDSDIKKIKSDYRGQLNIYAQALNGIYQKPVIKKYLYLLSISRLIEV